MKIASIQNYPHIRPVNFAKKQKTILDRYSIDPKKVEVVKPDDVEVSEKEKEILIEKVLEAHELAKKNYEWGNISQRGFATNTCYGDNKWYLGTNFNNTRNSVSNICGERTSIVGAYNDLLKSKPLENKHNEPLDFKIKYLAMSSYKPIGEDLNDANPCAECLSWFDTPRHFDENTLIANLDKDENGNFSLILNKISEYVPNRSEKIQYPTKNINALPIKLSKSAQAAVREKNISEVDIKNQFLMTKTNYDANKLADISGQNITASVRANDKLYFGPKMDFSKRWYIEPLEYASAKAIEKNGEKTKIDMICYIGDEEKKTSSSLAPDRVVNIKVLGELLTKYASPKTLIITGRKDGIDVQTMSEYLPEKFKYNQGYKI